MPHKKIASNSSLGKQLIKAKHGKRANVAVKYDEPTGGFKVHTSIEVNQKPKLVSVLEQNSLEEFVQLAQLSSKKFEAERGQNILISDTELILGRSDDPKMSVAMVNVFLGDTEERVLGNYVPLTIPRKPHWDHSMTAHEINQSESMSFLEWRRDIAILEQDNISLAITPFEKNLDIWRQLWRVIERSDLLLQIVDARNPYFFYSQDLDKYIKEVGDGGKQFILLINKADYLSPELIAHWNQYFKDKGTEHIFFSALEEQGKIDAGDLEVMEAASSDEESNDEDEDQGTATVPLDIEEIKQTEETHGGFKNEFERQEREDKEADERAAKLNVTLDEDLDLSTEQVFSRAQLLTFLKKKARSMQDEMSTEERLVVGTVGYPNVGKSSVINVLMGAKKVGVAALPGKTKHFQTLNLGKEILLCDCPGLVFPSFANSKAEMMCCGVLPIDQMRDHISPINLVMNRVPKEVLEAQYKVILPPIESRQYTTSTFLQVFASKKGWRTGSGTPAEMHAAKVVMKDYTTGRLLFCNLRPDFDPELHSLVKTSGFKMNIIAEEDKPSAQNYEEIKLDESVAVESSTTTNLGDEEEKSVAQPAAVAGADKPMAAECFMRAENDFDNQFFGNKTVKIKLNKGEKRQLKFAQQSGVNLNEVGDLRTYLNMQIRQGKQTHNTPHQGGGTKKAHNTTKKTDNYKDLDTYVAD